MCLFGLAPRLIATVCLVVLHLLKSFPTSVSLCSHTQSPVCVCVCVCVHVHAYSKEDSCWRDLRVNEKWCQLLQSDRDKAAAGLCCHLLQPVQGSHCTYWSKRGSSTPGHWARDGVHPKNHLLGGNRRDCECVCVYMNSK